MQPDWFQSQCKAWGWWPQDVRKIMNIGEQPDIGEYLCTVLLQAVRCGGVVVEVRGQVSGPGSHGILQYVTSGTGSSCPHLQDYWPITWLVTAQGPLLALPRNERSSQLVSRSTQWWRWGCYCNKGRGRKWWRQKVKIVWTLLGFAVFSVHCLHWVC